MVIVSFCLVAYLRDEVWLEKILSATGLYFITFSVVALMYVFGSYDITHNSATPKLIGRLVIAMIVSFGWVVLVNYFVGRDRTGIFGRSVLGGSLILAGVWGIFSRSLILQSLHRAVRRSR